MSREEAAAEIEALRAAFSAAEDRGDPSVQVAHRAEEDYIRMPPGRPPMDAEEAASSLRDVYASTDLSVDWESDGVIVGEDLAVDSGSFTISWENEAKPDRNGSWLLVYRRTERGDWEVIRDIYNWDEPAESG